MIINFVLELFITGMFNLCTFYLLHGEKSTYNSIVNCIALTVLLMVDETIEEHIMFNKRGVVLKESPYHICKQRKEAKKIINRSD